MGTLDGPIDVCCHGTSAVIQFEWFFYGFVAGLAAPYVWPLLVSIVEEARIARRDWRKRD